MKSDVYIHLKKMDLWKLDIIDSSFEEKITRKELIRGGIDLMFCTALKSLYMEGEITFDELEQGWNELPDYLVTKLKKDIGIGVI